MSKLCFILGCGETGKLMPVANSFVIGVNDCGKFGYPVNELVFINRPRHFSEPSDIVNVSRLDIIKATPVEKIVTLTTLGDEWKKVFNPDQVHTITVTRWRKEVQPDQVYHVDNSPFTAMSLAVTYGYKDIVLWGVDFNNHRYLKAETSSPSFSQFAVAVQKKFGVRIFKGHTDQSLNLPVWSSEK